jgi:rhodanese-related sulfurtransferase
MTQHTQTPHACPEGTLHELLPQQVQALLQAREAVLIDVREPGEFEAERIPGALLFPLSGFDPQCLPLQSGRRIIFQCGTGRRSALAARQVLALGQAEATQLAGGISAWKCAGLAVTRLDPASGEVRTVRA